MKNMFTFKMVKIAGIVLSVVMGLGVVAPAFAATNFVAGEVQTAFVPGTFTTTLDSYTETTEGNWVNDNDSTDILTQAAIDNLVLNNLYVTYDAGVELDLYTQAEVDAAQNADLNSVDLRNAFQIARSNGFVGTEAQWLDSLIGADGTSAYQQAVLGGYTGTETEWLDSLNGTDGTAGADGADGVDGTNGTDGVDGADGTNGTDGADGTNGTDGTDGADGSTGAAGDDFNGDARLTSVEGNLGVATVLATAADVTAALLLDPASTLAIGDVIVAATGLNADVEAIGTFDVTTTGGTPEVPYVPGVVSGTFSWGATFTITESTTEEGVWYDNGDIRDDAYVQSILDGTWEHSPSVVSLDSNNTTGTEFVAAVAGTDVFAGTGEFGEVADAITAEQSARIAADLVLATTIANVASELTTAKFDLNALISGNATDIANNVTDINAAVVRVSTLEGQMATAMADITANAAAISAEATRAIAAELALGNDISANTANIGVNRANIATNVASLVAATTDRGAIRSQIVEAARLQALVDGAQNMLIANNSSRLDGHDVILADHESRISTLEGYHPEADGSFSKIIDDGFGNRIAMHFNADGSQRGKARMLTSLENPVIHGEMDILWNDAGVAVNAITGLRVDANTGLPMEDKVEAEVLVDAPYVSAELVSDVRFGASTSEVMVEAEVDAPVISQSFTDAEIAKFKSMVNMTPVVELVAEETPVAKAAVVEVATEEVVVEEVKSFDLTKSISNFLGSMFSTKDVETMDTPFGG